MLLELRIKNFAIIDELSLNFSKGFNVLTGETGTGKSIILNAVHLLLGDKGSEDLIRSSEDEASVEAIFDISQNHDIREKIREKELKFKDMEEDSFLIRRILSRSGRGKVYMNEHLVSLGMLSEIGEKLLSLYGQHEHQSLQRIETHVDLLDEFGGLLGLRETFREHFERFLFLSEEIRRIRDENEKREREKELMAFQLKEIEDSKIQIGEEEALREEKRILIHAKKLIEFVQTFQERIYEGEDSALERIQSLLRWGREMESIDPSLSEAINGLETSSIQLEETALILKDYLKKIEIDPMRLEEVENRLEEIDRLKRKYGPTIEDIFRFKERVVQTLASFTSNEEKLSQLEGMLGSIQGEMIVLAQKLSLERKRVAQELKRLIEKELSSLGMKRTIFEVKIETQSLTPKGKDRVEFLLSPNVGEEVKPLAKIASGGELSRIMLAMKKILAKVGGKQVLIFDEVDSGIGGAIAEVVGRKLRELSKHHQVICVTHLPQIACFADTHHSVRKEVKGGRTVTVVNRLEGWAIIEEVARMLGGVKVTEKTRAHAKEMIENARRSVQ
ncbi:MAG: DNA repair protein RecN [Thermodesulfobacteriota bacterium]